MLNENINIWTLAGKEYGSNKKPLYLRLLVILYKNLKITKQQTSVSHYLITFGFYRSQDNFLKGSLNMRYLQ